MALNFRGGPPKAPAIKQLDPLKIFQARPALESQVNDVWRGQATALEQWYAATENDILISLNTGAGKSIVGTLICQSWLNAGVENPIYLCATNDLVEQTAREAEKLALKFSTRIAREYNNDLFETGAGFLITSYQTLFNAITVLKGPLSPGGIVFDDAHVGEPTIRSQFTLSIEKKKTAIYAPLISLINDHLSPIDQQQLRFVLEGRGQADMFLCPPEMGAKLSDLLTSLHKQFSGDGDANIFFPYLQLATHFQACAVVIRGDEIEISPPFLPTNTFPAMRNQDVKRVYLSATLKAESEFVRAYGRRPGRIIEPEVDAGNGERTIVSTRKITDGAQIVDWTHGQSRKGKVLIAVPSRPKAKTWESVARPSEGSRFVDELKAFRASGKGGFILAGRFDGIDLPDATCRLMVIAGLPAGGSALETYLWQIFEMQNLLSARVATRVTQLFGRIIRGRNDYGLFVLYGNDLINWISRDRNLALLPDLLQKQIKLGQHIQDDFDVVKLGTLSEFYEQVLSRDADWLDYYRSYIDTFPLDESDVAKRKSTEAIQLKAALVEAKFIEALWQRRLGDAAETLANGVEEIAASDAKLAGWHNLWSGAAYGLNGSDELAREHYRISKSRLPLKMDLPIDSDEDTLGDIEPLNSSESALRALILARQRTYKNQSEKASDRANHLTTALATPSTSEEAYRMIGNYLGYAASRPDNETGAGPDGLWVDEINRTAVSFELKTDKIEGNSLTKKEIGQSHNHVQWVKDNRPDVRLIRHFIVGKSLKVASNANPDPEWCLSEPSTVGPIVQAFSAEVARIRTLNNDNRKAALKAHREAAAWSLEALATRLCSEKLI